MIENIQKYRGVIIVTFVVAAAAFVLGDYNHGAGRLGNGTAVLKINGSEYSSVQFQKEGVNSSELAVKLAQAGDFSLYQFAMGMMGQATSEDQAKENFFAGRMLLREAKAEYGINPSEEKISNYIRSLRAFSDKDGKFDQEAYNNFIRKGMGSLGLAERDLRELVSDVLAAESLKQILGSGLTVDRSSIIAASAMDNQQITAEIARIDIASYKEKIKPTDEEIKAYWETIQDSFTTEPKRKFTYVIITPETAAIPAEEATPALPETASQEQKDAAAKAADAKKAAREAATASAKLQEQRKTDTLVDDFLYKLEEKKGAGFEELAKENKWEIKTTDFFTVGAPPKDLDVNLRASSTSGKVAPSLFTITETSDPFSKFSTALAIGDNQWLIARLDGEEKSRPKTFEEASENARAQYIVEKATEALKAAATEAVTKIKASLAAGKSFADAAKDAGISGVSPLPPISRTYRPTPLEPQNLFEAIRVIDPGSVTDPLIEGDHANIIHVVKREVVKNKDAETRIESEVTSRNKANESIAFAAWMADRIKAANIQQLNRSH